MQILLIASSTLMLLSTGAQNVMDRFDDEDMYRAMFENYISEYQKPYGLLTAGPSQLYEKRFGAFRTNLQRIKSHNEKFEQGLETFSLGLNDIADLTDEEYQTYYLGYTAGSSDDQTTSISTVEYYSATNTTELPDAFDWREHDAVTPVKNQGMCGSCWAFSAICSLECAYARASGTLTSFSEQELVDCVNGGNDTCTRGGEMQDGFKEIISHHGGKIDAESDYVYTGASKGVCHADDSKALGHFTSFVNVKPGDEAAMQAAVATEGVLSVAIDASSFLFQLYRHGVFSWPFCKNGAANLDHGVAVVGYGTKAGHPFWLVKNSWGQGWGMHGYILMSRNKKNQCGIATDASYPIMKKE